MTDSGMSMCMPCTNANTPGMSSRGTVTACVPPRGAYQRVDVGHQEERKSPVIPRPSSNSARFDSRGTSRCWDSLSLVVSRSIAYFLVNCPECPLHKTSCPTGWDGFRLSTIFLTSSAGVGSFVWSPLPPTIAKATRSACDSGSPSPLKCGIVHHSRSCSTDGTVQNRCRHYDPRLCLRRCIKSSSRSYVQIQSLAW